jgi:hypothetical protein
MKHTETFAIEEFGDQCWVYGSDIPHENHLYGAVDVFPQTRLPARRASESCSSIPQRAVTGSKCYGNRPE